MAIDDIRLATVSRDPRLVVAPTSAIRRGREHADDLDRRAEALIDQIECDEAPADDDVDSATDARVVTLAESVITDAISMRASDIHVEPTEDDTQVRDRIDGVLQQATTVPRAATGALLSRFELMAGMDIAQRRGPRDRHARIRSTEGVVDLRMSTLRGMFGEKLVARLLRKDAELLGHRPAGAERPPHRRQLSHVRPARRRRPRPLHRGARPTCGPTGAPSAAVSCSTADGSAPGARSRRPMPTPRRPSRRSRVDGDRRRRCTGAGAGIGPHRHPGERTQVMVTTTEQVMAALATVDDPEIGQPITELDMVADVRIDGGAVTVHVLLTVPGCPMKDRISTDVSAAVGALDGVDEVEVVFGTMTEQQRAAVASKVRGGATDEGGQPVIPFNDVDSDTKVLAVASGKGGVGKSSITVNLAVALAQQGYDVGILDADIWGYSIPRMLGVSGRPVAFNNMVMPLQGNGVKVISIGFFLDAEKPVIWRGPMLHRALQQFLADVHWGDLDFLLCDLPPGTGDIAISLAQMLPKADMLVVTTPQPAAQRVALRAGQTTAQTGMRVAGVIENMTAFVAPDTGVEYHIFGEGGGQLLAQELDTELLGGIPIDPRLREGCDDGVPLVVGDPESPAAVALHSIAQRLGKRSASLVGKPLPLAI